MSQNKKLWTAPDGTTYKEVCCFGKNESHMAITLERVEGSLELDFSEVDRASYNFVCCMLAEKLPTQRETYFYLKDLQALTRAIVKLVRGK